MEYVSGNLFLRDMDSMAVPHEAGWRMEGHAHKFHHNTLIVKGTYRCIRARPAVRPDGSAVTDENGDPLRVVIDDTTRTAFAMLPIAADEWHSFECVEGPGILLCVYSHRDPQSGEVVQWPNGWTEAYR